MKVNPFYGEKISGKTIMKNDNSQKTHFARELKATVELHFKDQADMHMLAIQEQGRRLCRSMTLKDLKKYRQMVAEFLNMCISQGLCLTEERMPQRHGKTRLLSIIKTVNKKLIDLAEKLISEDKDPLQIIALVDEIRGLLLDLYT